MSACTIEAHEQAKERAAAAHRAGRAPADTDAAALVASARPWVGAGLVLADCPRCQSTLAWEDDRVPTEVARA